MLVPVYDASSVLGQSQRASAASGTTYHFVHLTAEWCDGGFWVADLRLEVPVDKSHLIGQSPMPAFKTPEEYSLLADKLGAQRSRPAVPDSCLEQVVTPMFELVREADGLLEGVRELRVLCNDPNRPTEVTIFVVTDDNIQADQLAWSDVIETVSVSALTHGLRVLGPEITTLMDMSALDYVLSAAVADRSSS